MKRDLMQSGFRKTLIYVLLASVCSLFFFTTPSVLAASEGYEQLVGVIDIRTTYSDGDFTADQLVEMAGPRGIDVLVITDHDRMVFQYGLFPFRNLLRLRVEKPSVIKNGAKSYLEMLDDVNKKSRDVIIIPGIESAPFYYWSGWPLPGKITAHEWEKHLLVLGIEDPRKIEALPVLHSSFGLRYVKHYLPITILFSVPFLISLGLLIILKERKWWIWALLVLTFLLLVDHHPFHSSPFDPYHGDQGITPYQSLIDYVNACGGMSFWSHPETRTGVRDLGTIKVSTPPHPEDLLKARNYTGIAAVYGDVIKATEPGREWDTVLNGYCQGIRKRPCWGISSSDYHNEHPVTLGEYITTFLVRDRNKNGVMEAIRAGRMYNYIGPREERIRLACFEIEDPRTGEKAIMGETITCYASPIVRIKAYTDKGDDFPLSIKVIRSGKVCYQETGKGIIDVSWQDHEITLDQKHFYRIELRGKGRMLSNPIFFTIGSS